MRKLDLLLVAAILVIAATLRLWAPWEAVLGSPRVNFLETDAWYHVRLVESQVHNFPHRITTDPYASPNGQYVAVAPLLDILIATAVLLTQGPAASTEYIARVAAFAPAVMGVLAVAAVWLLGTIAFDRRAGLMAGLLAAVLPGHFLDRTLLGFVDHHALEVLLAFATLVSLTWAIRLAGPPVPGPRSLIPASAAGLCLGLYLLTWSSGAYFVAILAGWILLTPVVGTSETVRSAARATATLAATALVIVLVFQDRALFRYDAQVASLAVLLAASALVWWLAARPKPVVSAVSVSSVSSAALVLLMVLAVSVWQADVLRQIGSDIARFSPDPTRMAVLEARPLFMYSGNWDWAQPWVFFRSGFYVGLLALAWLCLDIWRSRRLDHLLIAVFTAANFAATVGQNRFGYYLVPATALVAGWLCARVFDWGGVPHAGNPQPGVTSRLPLRRELAVVLVAGLVVAPNLVPAAQSTARAGGMAGYWAAAMTWLRTATPKPFASPSYYLARYASANPPADYTVMNWWDQGYWLIQTAHRVPVSNPTQNGAPQSAAFYTATDQAAALAVLAAQRARYVLVDWELPFRDGENGAIAGRFQHLSDWAGIATSRFYSLCYERQRESDPWAPAWLYTEAYYQTMAYRLMVLGGRGAAPANNTWVVRTDQRRDAAGQEFCEVSEAQVFRSAEEASRVAASRGPQFRVVGRTPWQPAFPVPPVTGLRVVQEFREPTQKATETPMVRIFEVVPAQ